MCFLFLKNFCYKGLLKIEKGREMSSIHPETLPKPAGRNLTAPTYHTNISILMKEQPVCESNNGGRLLGDTQNKCPSFTGGKYQDKILFFQTHLSQQSLLFYGKSWYSSYFKRSKCQDMSKLSAERADMVDRVVNCKVCRTIWVGRELLASQLEFSEAVFSSAKWS